MGEWQGGMKTKPDWDDFYMTLSHLIAQRSVDQNTVHGACLVAKDNRLLSIGYNGPIRGSNPDPENFVKRPQKYFITIHEHIFLYFASIFQFVVESVSKMIL